MNGRSSPVGDLPEAGTSDAARYYKRAFWSKENLKFNEPWYRLQKSARIIGRLAQGRECSLLDIGCGPGTLGRLLPENVDYYGIDIAIHDPAPNLLEADILERPISFGDRRFDIVIAQGVFEYLGDRQSQKFSEISQLLHNDGTFVVSYTNFAAPQDSDLSRLQQRPAFRGVQGGLGSIFSRPEGIPCLAQLEARPTGSTRRQGRQHVRQYERTAAEPHLGRGVLLHLFIIRLDRSSPGVTRFMSGSCLLLGFLP